jgi:hypothetical protein
MLIENMKALLSGAPAPAGASSDSGRLAGEMTIADAINNLKLHRSAVKDGPPQRYDWRLAEPDIEEVRAEVLRKVAAMERARRG